MMDLELKHELIRQDIISAMLRGDLAALSPLKVSQPLASWLPKGLDFIRDALEEGLKSGAILDTPVGLVVGIPTAPKVNDDEER